MRLPVCALVGWLSLAAAPAFAQKTKTPAIGWQKTVVDANFRAEGIAVADFNKDGKLDIFIGDVWYEAPSWKMHVVRREKPYDPHVYSESFGCFADDFNGDGYPDVIVIPFPGKQCPWYENPGKAGGKWKEHILTNSACNETPIYVDLFKTGKKVLLMGWQPAGKENMGEMCYFTPGKDPTEPWERHSISGPSAKGKEVPGTQRFSHGLGHGDVNGDGRIDVIVPQGWWEQPEKVNGAPWRFHTAALGEACADMYAKDLDGDKVADVISTSAHRHGLWWYQQDKAGKFTKQTLATGDALLKNPAHHLLNPDEKKILDAINDVRAKHKPALPAFKPAAELCRTLRGSAGKALEARVKEGKFDSLPAIGETADGKQVTYSMTVSGKVAAADFLKTLISKDHETFLKGKFRDIGIAVVHGDSGTPLDIFLTASPTPFKGDICVWEEMRKVPVSQTHALVDVDIDGDGLKDLVTGRRWWAHGAAGDPASAEPAFVFWLRAEKDGDGKTTFTPEVIDDDSGIGTQFLVVDIDGDGIPDVIVANKRGVFILRQVRGEARSTPGRKD